MVWATFALTWLLFIIMSLGLYYLHNAGFFIIINSSLELSAVLLTAASLVLTGVAGAVALLAFFGYDSIKRAAIAAACIEARDEGRKEAGRVANSTVPTLVMKAMESVANTPQDVAEGIAKASDGNDGRS